VKVEAERVAKIRENGLKAMQDKERVFQTIFFCPHNLVSCKGPVVQIEALNRTPVKDGNA